MGKVGSQTIYESLRKAAPQLEIYHSHILADIDAVEAQLHGVDPRTAETTRKYLGIGKTLRDKLARGEALNVISMTRDPVARAISALFQNIEFLIPGFLEKHRHGRVGLDELRNLLFEGRGSSGNPASWFDNEFGGALAIDVYAQPFDTGAGFTVFSSERARALVVRAEDLDRIGAEATEDFLGIARVRIRNHNVASSKPYHPIYLDFLRNVDLPGTYLDDMYGSRFAQHFYSADELDRLRKSWSNRQGRSQVLASRAPLEKGLRRFAGLWMARRSRS
jgi:hypothetical protein